MSEPTNVSLSQCSLKYLRQLVNSLNWATDQFKMKHGGDAFDLMPEPKAEPVLRSQFTQDELIAYRAAEKAWNDEKAPDFNLSIKQMKAVKQCLEFYLSKAVLPPGKHSTALLKAFGIDLDSEE